MSLIPSTHVGRIVLTLNGKPVAQGKSVRARVATGRKALKGMNPLGVPIGTADGTPEYTLDCEFYIPKVGETIDWEGLNGAVLSVSPRDLIGKSFLYFGVFTVDTGEQYGEDDAAVRSVTMGALYRQEITL